MAAPTYDATVGTDTTAGNPSTETVEFTADKGQLLILCYFQGRQLTGGQSQNPVVASTDTNVWINLGGHTVANSTAFTAMHFWGQRLTASGTAEVEITHDGLVGGSGRGLVLAFDGARFAQARGLTTGIAAVGGDPDPTAGAALARKDETLVYFASSALDDINISDANGFTAADDESLTNVKWVARTRAINSGGLLSYPLPEFTTPFAIADTRYPFIAVTFALTPWNPPRRFFGTLGR